MDEGGSGLDIRVLGPTQMFAHGQVVDVPGRQQQALLAMFVLYRGRVLSSQRLLEALWGPAPTASAATSLRVSVSKLRRALSAASAQDVLVTSPGGYTLEVAADFTDVGRFEAAVDAARLTATPHERLAVLDDALALWRGSPGPLPEHDPGVTNELDRLAELRELALEERADAALQVGRHRELVPALEALVADQPLRERRTELLMRALARSGRQVEALEAYQRLRCRLVEDLGLEPSAELRNLQAAILSPPVGEPSVVAPPTVPAVATLRPRSSMRRRASVVGGAVVLATAGSVLMAVLMAAMGDKPAHPTSDLASTVARLDADTGDVIGQLTVSDTTQVGTGYGVVVLDRESAWVRNDIDQTVSRVDRATGEVTDTVPLGAGTGDMTIADGDLWAANSASNSVTRIDGGSGEVLATIRVGMAPQGIATAAGDVWVANHRGRPRGSVWRIDAETNEVVARIPVGAREFRSGPSWMAATGDALWVGVPNIGAVVRIDTASSSVVASIPIRDGGVCGRLSADATAVWVASGLCGAGALTRIDPVTNLVVARIGSPRWNSTFTQTTGSGTMWLATDAGPFEIDRLTNRVVGRLALAGDMVFGGDFAFLDGSLWIHDAKRELLIRLHVPAG